MKFEQMEASQYWPLFLCRTVYYPLSTIHYLLFSSIYCFLLSTVFFRLCVFAPLREALIWMFNAQGWV